MLVLVLVLVIGLERASMHASAIETSCASLPPVIRRSSFAWLGLGLGLGLARVRVRVGVRAMLRVWRSSFAVRQGSRPSSSRESTWVGVGVELGLGLRFGLGLGLG